MHVLHLGYPSATAVVLDGGPRVLVDSGYGSDHDRLRAALAGAGVPADTLDLVVNTHWHSDHVGGNARLQAEHGVPVAAAAADAARIAADDPGACGAVRLDQPVERYRVDRPLRPGDHLRAGRADWEVLATPGHTPTHLSLWAPDEGVLLLGDALHADDVGWIDLAADGHGALADALAGVERLATLPVRVAVSGHGPPITDPPRALAAAAERYGRMRDEPVRAAWHACKRILAFALMVRDVPADDLEAYAAGRPWLVDHATRVFATSPGDLARDLVGELRRAGAVGERGGRAVCLTPHRRPPAGWGVAGGRDRWFG